jgi:hypothetical protein
VYLMMLSTLVDVLFPKFELEGGGYYMCFPW